MYFAIGVEPTNEIAATSGWVSSASTDSLSPCTTLNTPSGSPASAHSSATNCEADGSRSEGLSTNVLPVAIATGYIHIGTMAGKLNGVIPAQTPSGWRKENRSTPVETWSENSPLSSVGMPQANSMTSRPRCTSPAASDEHLAVLVGDDLGELLGAGVDQLAEREEHLACASTATTATTTRTRRPRPARRCRRPRSMPAAPRPAARRWPGSRPGSSGWTCRWRASRRSNG